MASASLARPFTRLLAACLIPCALAGCASVFDTSDAAQERRAVVTQVVAVANLGLIDAHCLRPGTETVDVVRYRVGHAMYRQAYTPPASGEVHVGDTVRVQPRACTLNLDVAAAPN